MERLKMNSDDLKLKLMEDRIKILEATLFNRTLTKMHLLLDVSQRENKLWRYIARLREEYIKELEKTY